MARKGNQFATPTDMIGQWMNMNMLWIETMSVMSMRMLGMAGMWSVTPSENKRMVSEKPLAFMGSIAAAQRAALAGKRPDQIVDVAVTRLRRKTRSNSRRLAKRGMTRQSGPRR
ncbi:antifreeze protein [Heliomarina baculiformis]|uniref:antifreeze protein n=1 Tax=Heliomarina baculiformis TaxID=2872036 RepID=UPI001EE22C7A|nr:antifreeze protein [Heliomarina baculiformis]